MGYYPSGGLGIVLVVVVILWLLGVVWFGSAAAISVNSKQALCFFAAPGIAEELEGDLLALGRFLQNDFEPPELVTVQPVLDIVLGLFDDRFFKRMRFEPDVDPYHPATSSDSHDSRQRPVANECRAYGGPAEIRRNVTRIPGS